MEIPIIQFDQVQKSWQSEVLFHKLSFKIPTGSKLVLTGPSGSGKTTILGMILGFTHPDSGNIRVHDLPLSKTNIEKIRCQSGYIPQMPRVGDGLVRDSILFPFSFHRNQNLLPTESKLSNELEALGLEPLILNKKTTDISGGQSQRIAILIVKLLQRKLILLDEPTSALDPDSKKLVIEYLLNDPQLTVLSVSHDPDWIAKSDDQIKIKPTRQ